MTLYITRMNIAKNGRVFPPAISKDSPRRLSSVPVDNIPQTSEKGNKQTRFSLCERDAAGEQVRFGQREKDELRARLNTAINRTAPSGEMIYARETPPIFVDIGLQPYPMTMGQGHIRKGTIDIKDASHALGINGLIDAIDGLNDPIAIIASETHPLDN